MNKGNKKGQTIIEVMVAATLITVIMSAVLNLMYTGLKFSLQTREETRVIGRANKVMNEGLYQVNVSYPLTNENAFDMNTTIDGFTITRDLIDLTDNGVEENPEPGYEVMKDGDYVFMKMIVTVGIADKNIWHSDSRVIKVR